MRLTRKVIALKSQALNWTDGHHQEEDKQAGKRTPGEGRAGEGQQNTWRRLSWRRATAQLMRDLVPAMMPHWK